MRKHIFYVVVLIAALAAGFLILYHKGYYETTPCYTDCSYWEALAIFRGEEDIRKISPFNVAREEHGDVWYIKDGLARKITYQGEKISFMQFSPSKKLIGFYHDKSEDERAGKDVALEVMNVATKDVATIYEGDYKTSAWEWIDDDRVIVYYDCGSGCYNFTIVSTKGEIIHGPDILGLWYDISPDKQWLLGFVDWAQTLGVIVMNIGTKEKFEFVQTHISNYQYSEYAEAVWSVDGKKLATLNKRPKDENMEAIVLDVVNNFQEIYKEIVACQLINDRLRCNLNNESPKIFLGRLLAGTDI